MERCECLPLNLKFAQKGVLVKTKPFKDKQLLQLINRSECCPLARTHALSLGRHWLMALSMMLCLNSAQTEINLCCFCKVVWRRYLGEVGKFYRTLWLIYPRHCVSVYQNPSSIVEVMTKKFWCVFYASQCTLCITVYQIFVEGH